MHIGKTNAGNDGLIALVEGNFLKNIDKKGIKCHPNLTFLDLRGNNQFGKVSAIALKEAIIQNENLKDVKVFNYYFDSSILEEIQKVLEQRK